MKFWTHTQMPTIAATPNRIRSWTPGL